MQQVVRQLIVPGVFWMLIASPTGAVQLSLCQGHFESVRGPSFSYQLEQGDALVPADLASDLERSARAIYDSWESLLAARPPFVVTITLRVMADVTEFQALKSALAPDLPDVTGFYAWEGNLAVVLHEPGAATQTRRRALHEISHVVTASQTGAAPHWLAEGLAEFHEMITPQDDRLVVTPNERHRRHLVPAQLPTLEAFFAQPAEAWYRADSQQLYGVAWSLVYFLMQSPQGRGALGYTLQQSSTHSCQPYSAAGFLGQVWPGGLPDLERQWRAWLADGEFSLIPLD